ncbi:MAG: hypothetical protein H0W84_11255 [Bacteroidetes bacterium]|nr:hypothetical protein [Bacteroidota bacterium]
MNKIFKILEIIWLIMGCIGIIMCGYFIVMKDNQTAIYFLIFTLVCGIKYAIRKRQRIKNDASQQQNEKK